MKVKSSLTSKVLLNGFKKATEKAYGSVLKPVEGTMLTVIRETTEEGLKKSSIIQQHFSIFELAEKFTRKGFVITLQIN